MLPVLTIVEDFLPPQRALEIRREVREAGFKTVMIREGKDTPEVPYENVNVDLKYSDFEQGLERVFGRKVKVHQQAFRLGFKGSQIHNAVHADHICAQLASVYYMNDLKDCFGGTAFYRHQEHGWEYMPNQEQLDVAGYTIDQLAEDWKHGLSWKVVTLAGMRPNRLITYPTAAFHSRWPLEGFGHGNSARLIWAGFFDLV